MLGGRVHQAGRTQASRERSRNGGAPRGGLLATLGA